MNLFARRCGSWQLPYTAAVDGLSPRERLELEAHAVSCVECDDALRHAFKVDVALRSAFAPLRERRAQLAPGRVRLAAGPPPRSGSAWLRAPAFFARLAEFTVAAGVAMFAITGTLGDFNQTRAPQPPAVTREQPRSVAPSDVIDADYLRSRAQAERQARAFASRYDDESVEIVIPMSSRLR
jgi:anti-sigma factor RsiW